MICLAKKTKTNNTRTCIIVYLLLLFITQLAYAQSDLIYKNGMESGIDLFTIVIENTSSTPLSNTPITFAQPFKKGDVKADEYFQVIINGIPNVVQFDKKVTHSDGSIRHGIFSFILPNLAANSSQTVTFKLLPSNGNQTLQQACNASSIDNTIKAQLNIIGEGIYTATAVNNLADSTTIKWLDGNIATEWIIKADLINNGIKHSDIEAFFHVRCYSTGDIRTDIVMENTIAHQTDQNFDYSWSFQNGQGSLSGNGILTHYARARFRKTLWSSGHAPDINLKHDKRHIINSRAVANYDQTSTPSESLLNQFSTLLTSSDTSPMGIANIIANFPANDEASMDAKWGVEYLLSGDIRAYKAMIANANAAGSFGVHFRDSKDTSNLFQSLGNHPSVLEYSEIGTHANANIWLPSSPSSIRPRVGSPDTAHQDDFAYIPYLLTGDYYLLEEIQFWANWNFLLRNPGYRNEFDPEYPNMYNGLLNRAQTRSLAWGTRTLLNAAYISPDATADKLYFNQLLINNINFYNDFHARAIATSHDNSLGYLVKINKEGGSLGVTYGGDYFGWPDPNDPSKKIKSGIAPWMEHWVGAVFGRIYNTEIIAGSTAYNLNIWKSKFVIEPLINTNFCYILAPSYNYHVTDDGQLPYTNWSDIYQATIQLVGIYQGLQPDLSDCGLESMATVINEPTGAFIYSASRRSFYAWMQAAVAAAVDVGAPGAQDAWNVFKSSTQLPNWSEGNQYNIIPY